MSRTPDDPGTPGAEASAPLTLSDIHPSDCQSCSEDPEPCSTHRYDYRYWQARALDAETMLADHAYKS